VAVLYKILGLQFLGFRVAGRKEPACRESLKDLCEDVRDLSASASAVAGGPGLRKARVRGRWELVSQKACKGERESRTGHTGTGL